MARRLASVLLLMFAASAMAKDKHIVQVQVVSAETRHWTTTLHDDGSPGTQKTDCSSYGDNDATCTTKTEGYRAPSDKVVPHTQVDIEIKMPDGTSVKAQCRLGTWIWSSTTSCVEPPTGKYDAQVEKHGIRLLIPVQGRPEYNIDGTLKGAGKVSQTEIKFGFE
jgi:hypothetical protein